MMIIRKYSFNMHRSFLVGAVLFLWAAALSGCGMWDHPPEHSIGHKHKLVGVTEGTHLRYQEPDRYTWQYPERVINALELKSMIATRPPGLRYRAAFMKYAVRSFKR